VGHVASRVVIFDIDPDIRVARTLSTKVYGDPGLFIVQRLREPQLQLFMPLLQHVDDPR
jgi:hypothetical protein